MDKLILNLQDVKDPELLLANLLAVAKMMGAVGNGVYRINEDPDTGDISKIIRVINNQMDVRS
jgi:hypothetical protein